MSKKKSAIDKAYEYLYRYPKTEKELKIYLFKHWYSEEEVNKTIEILKKEWLINDKKFAESYIYSEIIKKGKPVAIIKQKLIQKGIDSDIVDEILKENEADIQEGISQKLRKEIEKLKNKWKNWFDIVRILLMRGYKFEDIKKLVDWEE